MSNKLELKKLEAEYHGVFAARKSLEYRIEEFLDNIQRLEDNMKLQKAKEDELSQKIQQLQTDLNLK